jgi:hypothetical protein
MGVPERGTDEPVFSMVMGMCRLRYGAGGRRCPLAKVGRFFGLVPAHQEKHPNTDNDHQDTAYGN